LASENTERNVKNTAVAEHFDERAADEKGAGVGRRPSDVVNADSMRHAFGRFVFADERFQHGPGETHSKGGDDGSGNLTNSGTELCANEQRAGHDAKADFQRVEISPAPRQLSGLPRRQRVTKSKQRGNGEIRLVAESKFGLKEKIQVIEIQHGAEGIHSFNREAEPLTFLTNIHAALAISASA